MRGNNKYNLGYVASPLNAPTQKGIKRNMRKARLYELACNMLGGRSIAVQGYVPAILDDHIPEEREMALSFGISILMKADAIILCGNRLSSGMKEELRTSLFNKKIYVLKGNLSFFKIINRLNIKLNKLYLEEINNDRASIIIKTGVIR